MFSVKTEGCKVADESFTERTLTVFEVRTIYTVKRDAANDETPDGTAPDGDAGRNDAGRDAG